MTLALKLFSNGVNIINTTLDGHFKISNFSFVENFTSMCSKLLKYFATLKDKCYISVQPCNILYIIQVCEKVEVALNPFWRLKNSSKSFIMLVIYSYCSHQFCDCLKLILN